jgi:hypothetical protein
MSVLLYSNHDSVSSVCIPLVVVVDDCVVMLLPLDHSEHALQHHATAYCTAMTNSIRNRQVLYSDISSCLGNTTLLRQLLRFAVYHAWHPLQYKFACTLHNLSVQKSA